MATASGRAAAGMTFFRFQGFHANQTVYPFSPAGHDTAGRMRDEGVRATYRGPPRGGPVLA